MSNPSIFLLILSPNSSFDIKSLYAFAVIQNPGGTLTPFCVSSPKFAPFPPTIGISSLLISSNHFIYLYVMDLNTSLSIYNIYYSTFI